MLSIPQPHTITTAKLLIVTVEIVTEIETDLGLVADVMIEGKIDHVKTETEEETSEKGRIEVIVIANETVIESEIESEITTAESPNHLSLTMPMQTTHNALQYHLMAMGLADHAGVVDTELMAEEVDTAMAEVATLQEVLTEVAMADRIGRMTLTLLRMNRGFVQTGRDCTIGN